MAIYKPSNCAPFMECWDATQKQIISCKLNTNNIPVTGYKLKFLDSKNNIVGEDKDFKPLPTGYEGLNESTLKIKITPSEYGIKNDYPYQPYKWQITLAQGQTITYDKETGEATVEAPTDDKAYDLTIVSGTVVGSTKNRIQSELSEEIYADYFVQLYDNEKKVVGERVLIDSYDHTYGYLYPEEGEFTDDKIKKASYFQVFKNTNVLEYISTDRVVTNVTDKSMDTQITHNSRNLLPESKWGSASSSNSDYYMIQTYKNYDLTEGEDKDHIKIPLKQYCASGIGNFVPGETLLLVKNQNDETQDSIYMSPYNGVFLFVSAKWVADSEDSTTGTLTVTWQRPAMADTWAEFLGQSFYVRQTGENYDSTATSSGTINSTPLGFKLEEAIKIYPNKTEDKKTYGEIFKTQKGKVYVNPFTGLESGFRFNYLQRETSGYVDNVNVNTDNWFITNDELPVLTPDIDTYSFTSFFKTSDENPFYAYTAPTITIDQFTGSASNEYTWEGRILDVTATYNSGSIKASWSSYKWTLEDLLYGTIKEEETKYDGTISAHFVGLENKHVYLLTLAVQDSYGRILQTQAIITINVTIQQTFKEPTIEFKCEDGAVEINVVANGVVINNDQIPIAYLTQDEKDFQTSDYNAFSVASENLRKISYESGAKIDYGTETVEKDALLEYTQTRFGNDENLIGSLYGPSENTYVLATKHSGLDSYYEGPIIRTVHNVGTYKGYESKVVCDVGLEPDTIETDNNFTKANPNRNKFYATMSVYRNISGESYVKTGEIISANQDNLKWRDLNKVVYAMVNSGTDEGNFDFIDCDEAYDKNRNAIEGCKNIRGLYAYNSTIDPKNYSCGFTFETTSTNLEALTNDVKTFGFFTTKKLKQIIQANDTKICVEEIGSFDYLELSTNCFFVLKPNNDGICYQQINKNEPSNHSGRQLINKKTFTLQAIFQNFDPTLLNVGDERKVALTYKEEGGENNE